MARRTSLLLVLALVLGARLARGGEERTLETRVDRLVARWREGDRATRAGVVAETKALGEEAIAELFRRVARPEPAAPPRLGIAAPAARETPAPASHRARLVMLTVRFARIEGSGSAEITRTGILDDHETEALRDKLEFVAAPRLTVYDGQRANVTIVEEKSYTEAYDAQAAPVKGAVQTGLVLDVRPTIDGDTVKLQLRCERARLASMDTVPTPAGGIEVPRVEKHETAITLALRQGKATVALPGAGQEPVIVEIEAKVLSREFEEAK